MFYKVSYNQGFCSLLGFGSVLKKKSQYLAEELGIVTLLFVICVYSILSSIDFNTYSSISSVWQREMKLPSNCDGLT